jgi:hypothetical protein
MEERFAIIRWDDEREEEILFFCFIRYLPYRASMLLDEKRL